MSNLTIFTVITVAVVLGITLFSSWYVQRRIRRHKHEHQKDDSEESGV